MDQNQFQQEAEAFNSRISERETHGFIPDLRRAAKCEYFYKSFWRDPHFVDLYLGENVRIFLKLLREFGSPGMRILDAGCGSGYISLELARNGYHVTGIDIAEKAIVSANRTLETNPFKEGFGSLKYEVASLDNITGTFDAIFFSGILHHFADPSEILQKALLLLGSGGLVICHEPVHERFGQADAAQVALIRGLLAQAGCWYDSQLAERAKSIESFDSLVDEIQTEYITERDPNETAQSPNDLSSTGQSILQALRKQTAEVHYSDGASFIYRLLGGIRGPDEVIHKIADFVTSYERYAVKRGFLQPNHFFFAGKKR